MRCTNRGRGVSFARTYTSCAHSKSACPPRSFESIRGRLNVRRTSISRTKNSRKHRMPAERSDEDRERTYIVVRKSFRGFGRRSRPFQSFRAYPVCSVRRKFMFTRYNNTITRQTRPVRFVSPHPNGTRKQNEKKTKQNKNQTCVSRYCRGETARATSVVQDDCL